MLTSTVVRMMLVATSFLDCNSNNAGSGKLPFIDEKYTEQPLSALMV